MAVYKSNKQTKDGRKYFFRIKYKDIFGISHDYASQKYLTKKEAEQEEALYRIKIMQQETNISNIKLKQIYIEIRNKKSNIDGLKRQTINKNDNLFKYLKPIENMEINNLDYSKYTAFLQYLDSFNISVKYYNKILGLLRQIIKYSAKIYNTSESIIKFIENRKDKNVFKKEIDFFTYDEYIKFDKIITEFEWHVFFEMLYFMGLRQGECQALTWEDVDFKEKVLKIRKTLTTKIKGEAYTISSPKTISSNRTLPIPERLYNDLMILKNNASKYVDFSNKWFIFGNSVPFKETTICSKKNKYCKLANVKQIRVHDFRHSCASLLISKGASISLVAKYLGHTDIKMTLNTYTHLYKNELESITNVLNNM